MIRNGRIARASGADLAPDDRITLADHADLRFDGAPLDPPAPLTILMHKPLGYSCTTDDPGRVIYDLLPPRFRMRKPILSSVGRLDKDTEGLLILTDDGQLLHRIIAPKAKVAKRYEARLDRPLQGHEAALFASGGLLLQNETRPLLPAVLEAVDDRCAHVTIHEGRYHQVRRLYASVGNNVVGLRRLAIGGLALPLDLAPGQWRPATADELAKVFA